MTGDDTGSRREALLGMLAGGGLVATSWLAESRSSAAEKEVELAKVPKVVIEAANQVVSEPKWIWASKIIDGDKTAYELDGTDALKRDVTVLVTADGKAVECETELKVASRVPEGVLKSVHAKWPKFTPTETHQIRRGENLQTHRDGDYVYDVRGTIAKGRDIQMQVSSTGVILESVVEILLEKVPPVVMAALKKERPKFEVGTAYEMKEEKALIGYHFKGKGPKGRDFTISVSPDGKQVEVLE